MPQYCRSRHGRVFRLLRTSELIAPDRMRYTLRAVPIKPAGQDSGLAGLAGLEVARELDASALRDKIARGQAIPTPEETFEQLWQQLRLDLGC